MSSIEKRDENTWRVRFRHQGKHCSVTHVSEKSARKWKAVLDTSGPEVALMLLNQPTLSKVTVGEHLENHIERLTGVTAGTRKTYRSFVARNMDDIRDIPVALLDHAAIAKWVNRLASEGLSGKTIANAHGLLSAGMNTAIADKITADNPCRGMRLPSTKHIDTEMTHLDPEEFEQLFELIPVHFQPFVMTLVGTGMRFGEATALQVGDVDLKAKSIRIRRAWKMTGLAKKELGPLKNQKQRRTVAIPEQVADILAPLLEGRGPKEFLFTSHAGKPILQATFWRNTWSPAVQAFAGDEVRIDHDKDGRKIRVVVAEGDGKHPRIHDLRHTFASWAIQDGAPLPVIRQQLGHESITTTVNTYGHLARADFDALGSMTTRRLPQRVESERRPPLELQGPPQEE